MKCDKWKLKMDLRDEELQMEEEGGAKVPRARRRCLIYSSLEIHRTLGAEKGGKSRSCAGIIIGDVDRERRVAWRKEGNGLTPSGSGVGVSDTLAYTISYKLYKHDVTTAVRAVL